MADATADRHNGGAVGRRSPIQDKNIGILEIRDLTLSGAVCCLGGGNQRTAGSPFVCLGGRDEWH